MECFVNGGTIEKRMILHKEKKKESEEKRILSSLKTLIIFQLDTSEQNHYTSLYTITQK